MTNDALDQLEEEFIKMRTADREIRRLDRQRNSEIAMIEDLRHRTAIEMSRLQMSRDGIVKQIAVREKYLRAAAAERVRERLGIPSIPGYTSPVEELVKRRLYRQAYRRKQSTSTPPQNGTQAPPENG